jgi:Mn2+/Fe2+ NRAMP family transporter
MIISAGLHPEVVTGTDMALGIARQLESVAGPFGKWCFLIGFWSAVFSSMLGVWQGVPYLFDDFVQQYTHRPGRPVTVNSRNWRYRGYLLYIAIPPMLLLLAGKPVWLVIAYAVAGAFFMPLLAALLLYMNSQRAWVGSLNNGPVSKLVLLASTLLFALLLLQEIMKQLN